MSDNELVEVAGMATSDAIGDHIAKLLALLGYTDDPDYLTDPARTPSLGQAHAVRSAFERMSVIGAFCPSSHLANGSRTAVPVLYVASCDDQKSADLVHRSIWSQSLVPLVLILTPTGAQIRNGFHPTQGRGRMVKWSEIERSQGLEAFDGIRPLTLRSSVSWNDFASAKMKRVDSRLFESITALNGLICSSTKTLEGQKAVANALIGRMLYLLVLIDRGVLSQSDVTALRDDNGYPLCPDVVLRREDGKRPLPWPADQFWLLADAIDDRLNGSIFPIGKRDRIKIDDVAINLARDVLRRDRALTSGKVQLGLLDVDYASLRTETISAIYEQFFTVEDPDRKKNDGAFYTPAYLVDYVLDEIDGIRALDASSIVCDPAAGSGAFLVAAFRRIVERQDGCNASATRLRGILSKCIHGSETNAQAANVARFSLYLTMLDYLPGLTFGQLRRGEPGSFEKLFPDLAGNMRVADFFSDLPATVANTVTHIVGNPPWTKAVEGGSAQAYARTLPSTEAVTYDNMAEIFAWRATKDLAAADGVIALVLATKSFVGSKVRAEASFPSTFATENTIKGLTNLSHFRRKLFDRAGEAAVVLFASAGRPHPDNRAWRYSPLLTSQPLDKNGTPWSIVVDRGQVEHVRQADLTGSDRDWFHGLMLRPLDRVFARRIDGEGTPTLATFMAGAGLRLERGGYEAETGVRQDLHLGIRNNYVARLGLDPGTQADYRLPPDELNKARDKFARMFAGDILVIPRSLSRFDVVEQAFAFNSTLQGLFFVDDELSRDRRLRVLNEVAAYLRHRAARYLFALVGKVWVLEQRRLEAADLERIPFPYGTTDDLLASPPSSASDDAITARIARECGLGTRFAIAVEDHHSLREGFQNGKVPNGASAEVTDGRRATFETVLRESLSSLFGDDVAVEVARDGIATDTHDMLISIHAGARAGATAAPDRQRQDLAVDAALSIDDGPRATTIRLSKPPTAVSWTVERAYSDAMLIARDILAS